MERLLLFAQAALHSGPLIAQPELNTGERDCSRQVESKTTRRCKLAQICCRYNVRAPELWNWPEYELRACPNFSARRGRPEAADKSSAWRFLTRCRKSEAAVKTAATPPPDAVIVN
jgi:hypothetical protein